MPTALTDEMISHLRRVLCSFPDAARLLDSGLNPVYENLAAGETVSGGLGHLCQSVSEGQSCPACQAARVLDSGRPERWKVAVLRRAEPVARDYYEVTQLPVFTAEGAVAGVLEILRDETAVFALEHFLIDEAERQEAEIHTRASEMAQLATRADELRQSLETLRQTQAEALYRDRLMALGRLVAGVAHEIHTPLGAVTSAADLVRRAVQRLRDAGPVGPDDPLWSTLVSSVDVVLEGAERIGRVVRTLRLYTRLDESERKAVDLHEGLESALTLVGHLLGDRIRIERVFGRLPAVTCRPEAINQVFMNLLLNGIQAIPQEGRIRICTRVEGDHAIVEFTDDGIGIGAEDLERIFEAGFTTKRRGTGTGLGLAICKKIVDDHGGRIGALSAPGEGSTFTVRLPIGEGSEHV